MAATFISPCNNLFVARTNCKLLVILVKSRVICEGPPYPLPSVLSHSSPSVFHFPAGERPEAMQTNAAPTAVALASWSCHFGKDTQAVRVISTMVAALVLLEACSSMLLQGAGGGFGVGGDGGGNQGASQEGDEKREKLEKPPPSNPALDPKEACGHVNTGSRNARW